MPNSACVKRKRTEREKKKRERQKKEKRKKERVCERETERRKGRETILISNTDILYAKKKKKLNLSKTHTYMHTVMEGAVSCLLVPGS
jgi:hypothetical protein